MKQIKKTIAKVYKRLISLSFDEITALTADKIAREVYIIFEKENKKQYKKIADDALEFALWYLEQDYYIDKKARAKIKKEFTPEKMVDKVIKEYNPVTGYLYEREAKRKRARLTEGLIAGKKNNNRLFFIQIIERYTNLWYTQSKQYAEDIADNTVLEVWKEVGVTKVKWVTQRDERVCQDCGPLDGQIFDIDKVPDKPHYRCRCEKIPVTVTEKVLTPKGD